LLLASNLMPITPARALQFGGAGNGTVAGVIQDGGPNLNLLVGVAVAGPGTWTFAGANTYVTNTTVTGGTLLVNNTSGSGTGSGLVYVQNGGTLGGSGSIDSTVTVQYGGAIEAGATGGLTVGTLNLGAAGSTTNVTYSKFLVSANNAITASTLNVSGTNWVQILDPSSSLSVGQYTLFSYFSGLTGFGSFQLGPLPAGVTANLQNVSGAVVLNVTAVPTTLIPTVPPGVTNFSLAGGNVVISGINGQVGYTYYLLTTTNLTTPLPLWNTVATNVLGAVNFTFIGTNAFGNLGQQFYLLSSTNYSPISPY